jgi:sulfite exporter TauE/SafE
MEVIADVTAFCQHGLHDLAALPLSLPLALFVVGLAGSAVHCAGMCGPFVLGQVFADSGRTIWQYGEWQRLAGAALMPYHLGRLTTYSALGGLVGAVTGVSVATTGFAWLSAAMLVLAALLMILQALGLAFGARSPLSTLVTRIAAPLSSARAAAARYALGLMLGLLPCGLLYGALAAAAGTASPYQGALAMAAFSVGTMPALIVVGWLGVIARRRLRAVRSWVATPLLVVNALLMLALASQRVAS